MAKRRDNNAFSLSFLDIMSCGFGAVILIFIVIHHSTETTQQESNMDLMAEVKKLELAVEEGEENLVELKNTIEQTDDEIVTTEGEILEIVKQISELQASLNEMQEDGLSQTDSIEALKTELKQLEEEAAALKGSVAGEETSGSSTRSFQGQGDRQYLNGVFLGGEHILILLDVSASMLDETIVNVVRRRNTSKENMLASPKWQRAIRTVEWIVANVPKDSNMQLIMFNSEATPAIPGSEASWIQALDRAEIETAVENLKQRVPIGGTSLHQPFALARALKPNPDNIFLIVDSLPTQGFEPPKETVITGRDRVRLFGQALDELPPNVPVNIILFPMEGDPIASASYWRLAQITGGAFLSPSKDWP